MQTSRVSLKKFIWLFVILAGVVSLMDLSSCMNNKSDSGSCLTLTKSQLDNWFPTFSNPSEPVGNQASILKFYPSYNSGSKNYDVTVRAFNAANAQLGNELTFNSGTCALPDPLPSLGKNYEVNLSDLHIIKADGSLLDNLTELMLTPVTYTGANLIEFNVEAKINGTTQTLMAILPCPPCVNCRPPCPDNCTPPCDSLPALDSMQATSDTLKK